MITRRLSIAMLVPLLFGCATEYPPVAIDAAKEFKSGTPLAEIKQALGEPHPPTAKQATHLNESISRMPEQARANAQKDKSLAWGNDAQFFAVKVNAQGVAWVTAWYSSQ